MELIKVDQEKCVQCGRCANVCPMGVIALDSQTPHVINQLCISCGHCVAVCPQGALDHAKAPLASQISLENTAMPDADTAYRFLRSRRSIRDYQPKAVPREKILQLLDIARFAPTGSNSQGVAYHIIDNPNTLSAITVAGFDWIKEQIEKAVPGTPHLAEMVNVVDNYHHNGRNVVLWNAPCLIIAVTDQNFLAVGRDNAHFSLTYAELYASSLGLGTCWAGVIESAGATGYKPLLQLLNLPANMCVTGALMAGYPHYRHKRLVDRAPLQVTWQST
ncbi:MAG TPA: nitroreductase family protein, partial [Negativicutes bacterium]